jgi:orotate phosphoribosyltransferase-like protein
VLRMAEITAELKEQGLSEVDIRERLQMEDEEVERLLDRSGMVHGVGANKGTFNQGWKPGGK